jgi:hypothetical protein
MNFSLKKGQDLYGSKNAEFKESDHPRADDGKFGSGSKKSGKLKKANPFKELEERLNKIEKDHPKEMSEFHKMTKRMLSEPDKEKSLKIREDFYKSVSPEFKKAMQKEGNPYII